MLTIGGTTYTPAGHKDKPNLEGVVPMGDYVEIQLEVSGTIHSHCCHCLVSLPPDFTLLSLSSLSCRLTHLIRLARSSEIAKGHRRWR